MAREYIELFNCPIRWPNFSGQKGKYNPYGKRTFNIVLDEETANELRKKNLNIRTHLDSNGENPIYTLQATVSFSPYPPDAVYRVIPKGKIALTEKTIGSLDHETIDHVDVKLSLSKWEMGNESGVKAYVSKLYVTVIEDGFADHYDSIPTIGGDYEEVDSEDDLPFN